ncbi:MAG: GNAT family N-acetyltransferase [Anaerolineales bacterium]|nr:GNAT family N-acetyltransferase [Anaerolineales bacterium]
MASNSNNQQELPTSTFCPRCGKAMTQATVGGRSRPVCPECGYVLFKNPVPGVGVLVEVDGGVVLIRRGHQPAQGCWALPAGFIEADESITEAAIRECKEETNLDIYLQDVFHVDSFPTDPTPQSGIIVFYRAQVIAGELRPGDDAVEAAVFKPDALPIDVAFRTHRAALARWAGLYGAQPTFTAPQDEVYPVAPDLLIRRSRLDDETRILQLLALIPANANLSGEDLFAASLRFRESTPIDVLVAEYQSEVVGFLVLSFVSALTGLRAWIDDLAVDPAYRRQGIGQSLVEAAIQRASRRGATHLFMDTSRGSSEAREFYRSCGFAEDGVAPLHIR